MNIDKALEHQLWRLKNTKGTTQRDVDAYNSIQDYKALQEQKSLQENENFAKLYIYLITKMCCVNLIDLEHAIQNIDDILTASTYEHCKTLKTSIEGVNYERFAQSKYPIRDYTNITELQERNEKIVKENSKEVLKAMEFKVKEDSLINFINKQINRTINKFQKSL